MIIARVFFCFNIANDLENFFNRDKIEKRTFWRMLAVSKMQDKQLNNGSIAKDKTALFETTPVVKALLTMAIPTVVSQLITMIYNLADTFFMFYLAFSCCFMHSVFCP